MTKSAPEGDGDVIILADTAIRTDGDIDVRFAMIGRAGLRHVEIGGRLPATDALLFSGDTDGAAADPELGEIGPRVSQIAAALLIDGIARSNMGTPRMGLFDPRDRFGLPLRIPHEPILVSAKPVASPRLIIQLLRMRSNAYHSDRCRRNERAGHRRSI